MVRRVGMDYCSFPTEKGMKASLRTTFKMAEEFTSIKMEADMKANTRTE